MAGVKGRSGRKLKWTEEQIEQAAEDLLRWLEEDPENHIWFKDWAIENGLPPQYLSLWAGKNPVFREAMQIAEATQESRLVNGGLKNRLNGRIVALVLESRHKWAGRFALAVTQEETPQKTLQDALRDCLPQDPAEARQWLQAVADGQGEDAEAEAVQAAAKHQIAMIDIVEQARQLGAEFAS